jgi:hypothetical protein
MKILTLSLALLSFVALNDSCKKKNNPTFEDKQLVLQPGSDVGQDCLVAARESDGDLYASSNHSGNPDVTALVWTYNADGAGVGVNRTYIKFTGLSDIPTDVEIKSAKLYLYGVESGVAAPIGNSYYPGSPYESYADNSCWLKRVTGSWSEDEITWNNKPGTTDDDKASIPASTSQWNYDAPAIDVTEMAKTMVKTGENNGFCLQLQTEEIYRGIVFGSSENTDATKRPKLVVDYRAKIK